MRWTNVIASVLLVACTTGRPVIWGGVGPKVTDLDHCNALVTPADVAKAHEHVDTASKFLAQHFVDCDVHALALAFEFVCTTELLGGGRNAGEYWGGNVGAGAWDSATGQPGRWARLMGHEFGHRVLRACDPGLVDHHAWMEKHGFPF